MTYPVSTSLPAPPASRVARTSLVVLASFLTQLVAVGLVGNQFVAQRLLDLGGPGSGFGDDLARTPLVYGWRFTPLDFEGGGRIWAGQVVGLLVLFLVAAVLTLALVRGPVDLGRILVGTTLSVIAATVAEGVVQRLITGDLGYGDHGVSFAVFGGNGFEPVAGLLLGLLTGAVAAFVATLTSANGDPRPVETSSH